MMGRLRTRVTSAIATADPKIRRLPIKEPAVQYLPVTVAAGLIGFGMAGLIDSILFRELLQWHVIAGRWLPVTGVAAPVALENLRLNVFWNGVYQAGAWIITASGVVYLWKAGLKRDVLWSSRTFGGSVLVGWGVFKVLESLLSHYLLGLHHVRESANAAVWDIAYLALGLAFILAGWAIVRSDLRAAGASSRS